jgi:hypothetical protein
MKVARFVLKIVAVSLAAAASICAVIAYWDKITEAFHTLGAKVGRARPSEYDDYADWDE